MNEGIKATEENPSKRENRLKGKSCDPCLHLNYSQI
jgi:hypothetical protein